MTSEKLNIAIKRVQFDVPPILKTAATGCTVIGLVAFCAAAFLRPDDAWRAYLQNFSYFTGIALGSIVWSAIMRLTNARWGRSLMRMWEGTVFFMPVALLLYVGLVIGGLTSHMYPWAHHSIPHKELWLSPAFVFGRGAVWLLLLTGVSWMYVRRSLLADVAVLKGTGYAPAGFERMFAAMSGSAEEASANQRSLVKITVAFLLIYAIATSMFAFDFLMSLEPHFYSTMFGGFIFVGNMFMGLAFIAIAAGLIRRRGLVEDLVGPNQFWDVGKLLFGFMMVWTYLMWSQYLPIWYGNMPEETGYLIKRVVGPYRGMSFLILALCWLIPWWMILPKKAKQTPGILGIAAAMTLVGVWLERWMIVAPSQFDVAPVPAELAVFPGWVEIGTGLLFAGLFLFSYRYFLANMPILPVGDPIFQDVVEHGSHGHH